MRNDDRVARMIEVAVHHGWVVTKTVRGHLAFRSPDNRVPIIHGGGTPGDHRAYKNLRSMLRRYGLPV